MVMPGRAVRWGRTLWRAVGDDLAGLARAIRSGAALPRGLFAYRVSPPGGSRILHLRVGADGRGTLLVDVNDVIHLNAAATIVAKLALDGANPEVAAATLRRSGADRNSVDRDVRTVYDLVDHLKTTPDRCPTCGLTSLGRTELFSVPVDAPYKADLALTYGCNNACAHCYNERNRRRLAALSVDEWKRVLQKLHEIGVPHLVFTGGEPTLYPHLVELIAFARAMGFVTGVNSNGRRFADDAFTRSVSKAGLSHLQVTLQSHRPEVHNAMTGAASFAEAVAGVRNALEAGLHTITNTTLTRSNAGEAEDVVDFLHELGLTTFAMNGLIRSGSGRRFADAIAEDRLAPVLAAVRDRAAELEMRFLWYTPTPYCRLSPVELGLGPKRCNAAQYTLAVEPDGGVLPCQSYYRPVGNLLRSDWADIWHSPLFRRFRDRVANPRGAGLPEACWDCPDLPICAGGCPIAREAEVDATLPIAAEPLRSRP